jgi:anionic cell wall polymer biosynthesis LytR-Cps2A-Psr (LCP) family protein
MRWKIFYVLLGFFIGVVVLFGFMLFGIENPFRLNLVKKVIDYTVARTLPETFCALVVGQDSIKPVRSDAIMLLSVNTRTEEIFLFSIPRDTRLLIPGVGYDKVNHAYAREELLFSRRPSKRLWEPEFPILLKSIMMVSRRLSMPWVG